jgi:DNA-binding response OmpR family regulator
MTSAPPPVLIVEDDAPTAESYARMLRLEGYEVRTAAGAAAALKDIDEHPPAAILVDLRMPGMDGLEFLRRVRAQSNCRETPVAMVTGDYFVDAEVEVELRCLNAQLRFKPLWLEDLITLVDQLLGRTAKRN